MGELLAFSQSSLLVLPHSPLCSSRRGRLLSDCSQASLAVTSPMCLLPTRLMKFPTSHAERKQCSWRTLAGVVSDSKVPTTFTVDSAGEGIDILPDSGGSDDNFGGASGNGGGGGNGGNHDKNESGSGGREDQSGGHEKKEGMSMSQKLRLGYAALVGIGRAAMGYLKSGSDKLLIVVGLSASILYNVYTLLPSHYFNGGGGGNGGNHDKNESGLGGREDQSGGHEKKEGMSMSQKLTLEYAALVGIGGEMGYLKSGSHKSLIVGGLSASILYYVYTLLPSHYFNGGGGGNGGNHDKNESGSGGREDQSGGHEKREGMSMSQKLTLGYAALVGIGGAMGYLKSGSHMSNPVLASSLGLVLSAPLLGVMGSRFKKSGKIFPADIVLASSLGLVLSAPLLGVMGSRFKKSGKIFLADIVSFASLVMSGGYMHGTLRSLH